MAKKEDVLRQTLARIAEIASAEDEAEERGVGLRKTDVNGERTAEPPQGCRLKALPERLLVPAAKTAMKLNPVNAPARGALAQRAGSFSVDEPLHIAVLTSKYWGPSPRTLTVSFLDSTSAALRDKILSHMNTWGRTACITFAVTTDVGQVRISRGAGGYWSYLGTDILHIPRIRPTMNLEGFSLGTPESEYRRVVRHETGHTLGFPHEHMRQALVDLIDPEKAYPYFLRTQGWDKTTVDQQVLTPLSEVSLMGTPVDETSIMCYQLPGSITYSGEPITGGIDINETDYTFAGTIYPKPSIPGEGEGAFLEDDWPAADDELVSV